MEAMASDAAPEESGKKVDEEVPDSTDLVPPKDSQGVGGLADDVRDGAANAASTLANTAHRVGDATFAAYDDLKGLHGWFVRTSIRYPRAFNTLVGVVLPLFFLIGVSFLCGFFLATVESAEEVKSNDDIIAARFNYGLDLNGTQSILPEMFAGRKCLINVANHSDGGTGGSDTTLEADIGDCMVYFMDARESAFSEAFDAFRYSPTFDWTVCEDAPTRDTYDQISTITRAWIDSYVSNLELLLSQGAPLAEAMEMASDMATGHGSCDVHTAGGALFWFTVMTTIGYGNTAPVTWGGRALVFTLGFVSILLFGAVINQAGNVTLAIFDDFSVRHGCRWLERGIRSVVFWFMALILWMLCLAAIVGAYSNRRDSGEFLHFKDALWFVYITTTTVGLGDIYVHHEHFYVGDMIYLPFIFLLAFVLMANFLKKLTQFVVRALPRGPSMEEVLEAERARTVSDATEEKMPVS